MANKTFYITTPIYYPNAKPHLGHAYTTIIADIMARYHRLVGDDTYFLTGTDENTRKVEKAVRQEGEDVREFLEEVNKSFKKTFADLNISNDQFIRTSDKETHWPGAVALWKKLGELGDIYQKEYEGYYCAGCEKFITEKELVDGKCPDHGDKPEHVKEKNYFFRLSKYTEKIKEKIERDEFKIIPESRKNEILALLKEGLQDVSFSREKRDVDWGIPVPDDESQTMYVWCDALSNYISALGFGQENDELFKKYWPADFHVIGKDILRFHAAIWPGMLLSADLPLPKAMLVHGFITSGGKKMSKTLGNVIDPQELIDEYGAEALRYFCAREVSPFDDGDVTQESFKEVYNANLANGLGNLVSRIMKMAETHLDSVPTIPGGTIPQEFKDLMGQFEIQKASDFVWQKISELDQKIQETQPFKLVKEDKEKADEIIKELVIDLYAIGRMLNPILPDISEKIKEAIKENKSPGILFPRKD